MDWIPIVLTAWMLSSASIAVVVGRAIHLAAQDRTTSAAEQTRAGNRVVDIGPRLHAAAPGAAGTQFPLESEEASRRRDRVRTLAVDDQLTRGPEQHEQYRGARPRR